MGDSSIRCAISGIPIPCGTPVLAIEMARDTKYQRHWYPLTLPVLTEMGCYGEGENLAELKWSGDPAEPRRRYTYVLPALWEASGDIWLEYMQTQGNGWSTLDNELEEARRAYKEHMERYTRIPNVTPAWCVDQFRLDANSTQWLRRVEHILLFGPDFGRTTPVHRKLLELVKREAVPAPDELEAFETFVKGFMASCLTGVDLTGGDANHPLEQYPTLKWDLKWNQAKVAEIKRLRATAKQ